MLRTPGHVEGSVQAVVSRRPRLEVVVREEQSDSEAVSMLLVQSAEVLQSVVLWAASPSVGMLQVKMPEEIFGRMTAKQ